jgi:hypothetical protein
MSLSARVSRYEEISSGRLCGVDVGGTGVEAGGGGLVVVSGISVSGAVQPVQINRNKIPIHNDLTRRLFFIFSSFKF